MDATNNHPTGVRRTRRRFIVLTLLALATMVNYLDRTVLGIAAPSLTKELGIDAAKMGIIFSAFSWSYVAMQIPGGLFLDRFGAKITYFLSVTCWSLITLLHGLAGGIASLLGLRLLLGIAEAPCFPTNSRVVGTWFPQHERATATGVYTVGEYVGLAFLSPLLFWLMANSGWRALFFVVGVVGVLIGIAWWRMYTEPHESKHANQAELDYIAAGEGGDIAVAGKAFSWANLRELFRHRQIWGACIGQFAGNTTLVFFLTWFPTYLATERQMGWIKMGFFAVLPFVAAATGVLLGGVVSDYLLKRTGSANIARKLPIITGLLMASSIILANYVQSDAWVIAILSLAFFGQGMVGLGWVLISDIAPRDLMGMTGGVFNLASNMAGIITPLVIGFIVASTGSFVGALSFVGGVALFGAFAYLFILGDVRRVEMASV